MASGTDLNSPQSNTSREANNVRIDKLETQVREQDNTINTMKRVIQTLVDKDKDMDRIKQLLNINQLPQQSNINLKSHQPTPELDFIGKSIHTPNIGKIMNVDASTWKYKDSHCLKISKLFDNSASITKIQQLRERTFKGEKIYPVNIYFSSQMHRDQAVNTLKNICKNRQQRCPPIQYALTGFPDLQTDMKWLSKILGEMKVKKLCIAYSFTNFSMTETQQIIPLYSIKLSDEGPWSKEFDSRTMDFFRSKGSFLKSEDGTSEMYLCLRNRIDEHIHELHTMPEPRPFVRDPLYDFIKSPKH